jgi:hypothetical protein
MEVVKMVATKMESIKPQKLATVKKFFRSAWWITKTFVKISPLVAAPLFAQQKDSAKVADEAFFKPSLAAKAYVREFAGGKDVGAGLGVQAGVKWQMLSCKGALSLAKDSSCVKGDGFNVSVSGTTGVFTNSVYVDNDPLIRPTAVYGISTSAYGALVKIERSTEWKFTGVGASYTYSNMSLGATASFGVGKNGEAGVQKIIVKAGANCSIASNVTGSIEASNIYVVQNSTSTLGARVSVTYTIK